MWFVYKFEEFVDDCFKEFLVCFEEMWVLVDDIYDVICDYGFIVFIMFYFS